MSLPPQLNTMFSPFSTRVEFKWQIKIGLEILLFSHVAPLLWNRHNKYTLISKLNKDFDQCVIDFESLYLKQKSIRIDWNIFYPSLSFIGSFHHSHCVISAMSTKVLSHEIFSKEKSRSKYLVFTGIKQFQCKNLRNLWGNLTYLAICSSCKLNDQRWVNI